MEAAKEPKRRTGMHKSCTECRRRKQKCIILRYDAPCANCSRRFPAVDCVIIKGESPGSKLLPGFQEQIMTFDDSSMSEVPKNIANLVLLRDRSASSSRPSSIRESEDLAIRTRHVTESSASAGGASTDFETIVTDETKSRVMKIIRLGPNFVLDGRGDPNSIMSFGGLLSEVNCLNSLPIKMNARNSELLHFYLRFVAPNLVSIDGESQPAVFLKAIMPWQLQSPLMPTIGMLMASTTQTLADGLEIDQSSETLDLKSRVLGFINQFLKSAKVFDAVAAEIVKCVINLVVMEWFWGADDSMWAHLRGIKEMLKVQGGLRGIHDFVGERIILLTDYEIACCFERDVFLQRGDPVWDEPVFMSPTCPPGFDCPLVPSPVTFENNREALDLNLAAAKILDDVRFLTLSITSPTTTTIKPQKIQTTASWLHARLEAMPPPDHTVAATEEQLVLETIRNAALIYSWSIKSLQPISHSENNARQEQVYSAMRSVSLKRWKDTPGIFLWIMLVACPSATGTDAKGRFIRRKMAVAGLSIGFEDFNTAIPYLRGFWLVQRWIARKGEESVLDTGIY